MFALQDVPPSPPPPVSVNVLAVSRLWSLPPSYTHTVLLSVSRALQCAMDSFHYCLYTVGCEIQMGAMEREKCFVKQVLLYKKKQGTDFCQYYV